MKVEIREQVDEIRGVPVVHALSRDFRRQKKVLLHFQATIVCYYNYDFGSCVYFAFDVRST
jgi:hypothetical protein